MSHDEVVCQCPIYDSKEVYDIALHVCWQLDSSGHSNLPTNNSAVRLGLVSKFPKQLNQV